MGFTSLADRDGAVPGGLVLDVDAAGHVAATAALPRDGSSSAFSQNAYRFVPWDSIAGESAASPLSGGAWELYKYAFAVGPGAAPRALDVAGAVLGPPEAVLNLGCDGRKASVDLGMVPMGYASLGSPERAAELLGDPAVQLISSNFSKHFITFLHPI